MIRIEITNEQKRVAVDQERLRRAVADVLAAAGKRRATISIALVDDPTIHDLNRRFLAHDYATDVLSFVFDEAADAVEGEIIASGDTAAAAAADFGWTAADELLLYVIHGALHLVGYDDKSADTAAAMRAAEARHLAAFGLQPRAADDAPARRRTPRMAEGTRP